MTIIKLLKDIVIVYFFIFLAILLGCFVLLTYYFDFSFLNFLIDLKFWRVMAIMGLLLGILKYAFDF